VAHHHHCDCNCHLATTAIDPIFTQPEQTTTLDALTQARQQ
jgi:hypothetical protein